MNEDAMMRIGYTDSCEHGLETVRFTKAGNIQSKRFSTIESAHKSTASLYIII
jgi:hypothetical protein